MNNITDKAFTLFVAASVTTAVLLYDYKTINYKAHNAARALINEGQKFVAQEKAKEQQSSAAAQTN